MRPNVETIAAVLNGKRSTAVAERLWTRLVDHEGNEVMETLGPWLQFWWGRHSRQRRILVGV